MAFTAGLRIRKPLLGIFPADGAETLLQVRPWLAQLHCQRHCFPRCVFATPGNWRNGDRDLPAGMVFSPWCLRMAAMLLTAGMMLILVFAGVDAVTFRNIGLVGAAVALLMSSYQEIEA